MTLLSLLLACAGGPADTGAAVGWCDGQGDTVVGVVSSLWFARPSEDGVCEGFDLDGEVSTTGGASGCGIGDYVNPEGVPGIDNGFAALLPVLEATEAAAVEGLIQDSIERGELLILFELRDVDHPTDDPCVDVAVHRGMGEVALGTDGVIEAWQTFDVDTSLPGVSVGAVPMVDGRLDVGPIDLDFPANVLGVDLLFPMRDGMVRIDRQEDGTFTGIIAGGLDVEYLLAVASEENVDSELVGLMSSLLAITSDLDPKGDGSCDRIAITFTHTAQPAFLFADPPPAAGDTGATP